MSRLTPPECVETIPKSINIRKATSADAAALREISIKLNIDRSEVEKTGFVDFEVPDQKRYVELIKSGGIYVAEQDGKVVGFVSCFDSDFLKEKFKGHGDEIIDHLLQTKEGDYYYLEQIAVLPEYQRSHIASSLINQLKKDHKEGDVIWTAVSLSPIDNTPSKNLFHKFQAEIREQIEAYTGLIFSLYQMNVAR